MTEQNVTTWADGYGLWHASVPLSGSRTRDAHVARRLIRTELEERYAPSYDRHTLHVRREHVTNHGTAIYREV